MEHQGSMQFAKEWREPGCKATERSVRFTGGGIGSQIKLKMGQVEIEYVSTTKGKLWDHRKVPRRQDPSQQELVGMSMRSHLKGECLRRRDLQDKAPQKNS